MNDKQKKFAEYYIGEAEGNAAKAAIMAGYSEKYARANAHQIKRHPEIVRYIDDLNRESGVTAEADARIASATEIQAFWTSIFEDENQATRDRLRASELLAKVKRMFDNDGW